LPHYFLYKILFEFLRRIYRSITFSRQLFYSFLVRHHSLGNQKRRAIEKPKQTENCGRPFSSRVLFSRPIEEVIYAKSHLAQIGCELVCINHWAVPIETIQKFSDTCIKSPSPMWQKCKNRAECK